MFWNSYMIIAAIRVFLLALIVDSSIYAAEVDYWYLSDEALTVINEVEEVMQPLGAEPISMKTFIDEVWIPGVATLHEWPKVDWDAVATRNVCRFALQYALVYWQHSLELGQPVPQGDDASDYGYYRGRCESAVNKFDAQGHAD